MTFRSQSPSGFRSLPGISFSKEDLSDGWAYIFRHETLGLLGRIVLRDTSDGHTRIVSEAAGDPLDPSTMQRIAVLEPLTREILRRIDEIQCDRSDTAWEEAPQRSFGEPKEVVASQLIPCGRCGENLALLIFAVEATDAGRFEDYARLIYPDYSRLNLATWIIGPSLADGAMIDRPADMLKVWPVREPMIRQQPSELNALIDQLQERHCR